jgi:defect-in-organelle-trafficking protein DotA
MGKILIEKKIRQICTLWLFTFMIVTCSAFFPTVALAAVSDPVIVNPDADKAEEKVDSYLSTVKSCANDGENGFSFMNCITSEDKSFYYLERIFGDVGDVLQGQSRNVESANGLLGALFRIYNIVVLTIGTIVLVYTTIVSTINTSQEGEVMGRKWSSIWIPIRSAIGVGILMPSVQGFSLVQVLIMWIIVQGIGAGNAIWEVVLQYNLRNGSINQASGASAFSAPGIRDVAKAALRHVVCQETINKNSTKFEGLRIEMNATDSGFEFGSRDGTINSVDREYLPKLCGSITVPDLGEAEYGDASTSAEIKTQQAKLMRQIKLLALRSMYQYLESQVLTSMSTTDKLTLESELRNTINQAISRYVTTMQSASAALIPANPDKEELVKNAMLDGWIFAGSYYFNLVKGDSNTSLILKFPPTTTSITAPLPSTWLDEINKNYNNIIRYSADRDDASDLNLGGGNTGGTAGNAMSQGSNIMVQAALAFTEYLSGNDSDPIISMQKVGSDMALTVEILFFSALIGLIALLIAGWSVPYPGLIGTGWAASDVVSFIMPLIGLMCGLLWGAAMTLGLYIPMVPYLVFTLASITWLLVVLEAMVAAPLIALGLVAPSNDQLGRASHAVLLITNIFMRPALMVIGFVAGSKLLIVGVELLNFGFREAVGSQIGTLGMLGALVLIVLYTALITSVAHKSFSLIHVIPDRVIRWIGGSPGQSSDGRELQQTQSGFDQGSKQAGEMQEKGAASAGEKLHDMGKAYQKKVDKGEIKKGTTLKDAFYKPKSGGKP